MAKMKWIYQMVQDGTFDVFKLNFKLAKDNNLKSFIFDDKEFDLLLGQAIIQVGEQATHEYDQHVDKQSLEDFKEWSIQQNIR
jgi:hypothetical protein